MIDTKKGIENAVKMMKDFVYDGGFYKNINALGAVADGTTDNSEIFQKYDYLYVPEGTYKIDTGTMSMIPNKHIIGEGTLTYTDTEIQWNGLTRDYTLYLPISKLNDKLYMEMTLPSEADTFMHRPCPIHGCAPKDDDGSTVLLIGAIYSKTGAELPDNFTICLRNFKLALLMKDTNTWELVDDIPYIKIASLYKLPWQSGESKAVSTINYFEDHIEIPLTKEEFEGYVLHFYSEQKKGYGLSKFRYFALSYECWVKEEEAADIFVSHSACDYRDSNATIQQGNEGRGKLLKAYPRIDISHNIPQKDHDIVPDKEHLLQLLTTPSNINNAFIHNLNMGILPKTGLNEFYGRHLTYKTHKGYVYNLSKEIDINVPIPKVSGTRILIGTLGYLWFNPCMSAFKVKIDASSNNYYKYLKHGVFIVYCHFKSSTDESPIVEIQTIDDNFTKEIIGVEWVSGKGFNVWLYNTGEITWHGTNITITPIYYNNINHIINIPQSLCNPCIGMNSDTTLESLWVNTDYEGTLVRTNKEETLVNVKSFGAVGDGVTDDTSAITKAFTKSNNVYFPAGVYLTNQISLTGKTKLTITGDNAVLLASPSIENYQSVLYIDNSSNILIKGITIDGNKENIEGDPTGGVFNTRITDCHDIEIIDCKSVNSYYGVVCFYDECYNIVIDNFTSYDTDCGLIFAQTQDNIDNGATKVSHDVIIRNSHFERGTSEGISLYTRASIDTITGLFSKNHYNFDIFNCVFDSKSDAGHSIYLYNAEQIRVKGCVIKNTDNCTNNGIYIYSANDIDINDCYINNCYYKGITISSYAKNVTIQNCHLLQNVIKAAGIGIYIKNNIFNDCFKTASSALSSVSIENNNIIVENNIFEIKDYTPEEDCYFLNASADVNNVKIINNTFIKNDITDKIYDINTAWGSTASYIELLGNNGITSTKLKNTNTTDVMLIDGYLGYSFSVTSSNQYCKLLFVGNETRIYNFTYDGEVHIESFLGWKPKEGTIVRFNVTFTNAVKLMNMNNIQTKTGESRLLENGETIQFIYFDGIWHEI